jgi:hypothetical protein
MSNCCTLPSTAQWNYFPESSPLPGSGIDRHLYVMLDIRLDGHLYMPEKGLDGHYYGWTHIDGL